MTRLSYLPLRIVAGESIWVSVDNTAQDSEDIVLSDFAPSDGSTLAYQFSAETPITVDAVANDGNTGWTLEVTGAQTLLWAPGSIRYAAILTESNDRTFCVDAGYIAVDASPLRVSDWVAVLSAVDAAILDYAANPYGQISQGDMSFSYRSLDQLTALRDWVKYRLDQDSGKRQRRVIRSRFNLS